MFLCSALDIRITLLNKWNQQSHSSLDINRIVSFGNIASSSFLQLVIFSSCHETCILIGQVVKYINYSVLTIWWKVTIYTRDRLNLKAELCKPQVMTYKWQSLCERCLVSLFSVTEGTLLLWYQLLEHSIYRFVSVPTPSVSNYVYFIRSLSLNWKDIGYVIGELFYVLDSKYN